MKRLILLAAIFLSAPASAQTWDVRIKELSPAGGVCVTGLLAGILQTAPCSLTINTGPGITGGPIVSTGTITLSAFRAEGRLVASTGIPSGPIPTASVTNATNLFYIPSQNGGELITIDNGTITQDYRFGTSGIVLALGTSWGANSAFDVFAALIGGAPALCTVPWTSLTARATALDRTAHSYLTNSASVACRTSNTTTITVPANQATYLGSFYTNGGPGQVDFNFGGSGAGGVAGSLGVWNAYNQVPVVAQIQDSSSSWTYSTAAWRSADGSSGNSLAFMVGVAGSTVSARYAVAANATGNCTVGIFLNGALTGMIGTVIATTGEPAAEAAIIPPVGLNSIIASENAGGIITTFSGAGRQGLSVQLWM